jgi:hypothetical protein
MDRHRRLICDDDPTPYRLADEPLPRQRYRPMRGFRASFEREPDPFDQSALRRFFGTDPFPWALALCTLLWVGLGLATRAEPLIGFALVALGLIVCLASQVWLYLSIFMEDTAAGFMSLLSGWYRVFYLYMNPELAWRPSILAGMGILMAFTGIGLFLTRAS